MATAASGFLYPSIINNVTISLTENNYSSSIMKKIIPLQFDRAVTITDLVFKYYDASSNSYVEFYRLDSYKTSTDLAFVYTAALIPIPDNEISVAIKILYKYTASDKTYNITKDGIAKLSESSLTPTLNTPTITHYSVAGSKRELSDILGKGYNITKYGQIDVKLSASGKVNATIEKYVIILYPDVASDEYRYEFTESGTVSCRLTSTVTGKYTISIYAIDSRGARTDTYTDTFTVLPYNFPQIRVSAMRLNGYEIETNITFNNISYSPLTVDGTDKNSFSVYYQYKTSSDSTGWNAINLNYVSFGEESSVTVTEIFSDTEEYIIHAVIQDKIAAVESYIIVPQGVPKMVEATDGHISIGMVPDFESSSLLQVSSDIMATDEDGNKRNILEEIDSLESVYALSDHTHHEIYNSAGDTQIIKMGVDNGTYFFRPVDSSVNPVVLGSTSNPYKRLYCDTGTFDSATVGGSAVSTSGHTHSKLYNSSLDDYVSFVKDGNYGYFRPDTADLVYCGSSNRPWYKVFTNRLEVVAAKPVFTFIGSDGGGSTVSGVPNIRVAADGTVSRTTHANSSKTIKHDIKRLGEESTIDASKLYDVEVFQFKYNKGVIDDNDCRHNMILPGFIIEDLDEKYPIAVDKTSDNVKDWTWNANYLLPPMLKLIQEQHKELELQRTEINDLKDELLELKNIITNLN